MAYLIEKKYLMPGGIYWINSQPKVGSWNQVKMQKMVFCHLDVESDVYLSWKEKVVGHIMMWY